MLSQEVGDGVFWCFDGCSEVLVVCYGEWRVYFSFGFSKVDVSRKESEGKNIHIPKSDFREIIKRARLGAIEIRRIKSLR